jgi:hypothetical protein
VGVAQSGRHAAARAFLVLAATFLWSLAGLFARLIPHLDFGTVLFFRALFGGACGLALAYLESRLGRQDARRRLSPLAPLVVGLAAFAISAYVAALMTTTVADVPVIYATLPFFAAGMVVCAGARLAANADRGEPRDGRDRRHGRGRAGTRAPARPVAARFRRDSRFMTLVGGAFVVMAAVCRLAPELRRPFRTVAPAVAPL